MKPRPVARTQHAKSEGVQPPKALGELPIGAVALTASQAAPLATLPSASAVNVHAQAVFEPPVAQSATEPELSATQQQTVQTSSSRQPRQSAGLSQSTGKRHQTDLPHHDDTSGLQPASPTVDVDLDNTGHLVQAEPVSLPPLLPPAPRAAQKDSAALMSMVSSGKRLHEAVSQLSRHPAQHKDRSNLIGDPLQKKPKLVPGQ